LGLLLTSPFAYRSIKLKLGGHKYLDGSPLHSSGFEPPILEDRFQGGSTEQRMWTADEEKPTRIGGAPVGNQECDNDDLLSGFHYTVHQLGRNLRNRLPEQFGFLQPLNHAKCFRVAFRYERNTVFWREVQSVKL